LERGRVRERWRSECCDSLHIQFPNWVLRLPGVARDVPDSDAFSHYIRRDVRGGGDAMEFVPGWNAFSIVIAESFGTSLGKSPNSQEGRISRAGHPAHRYVIHDIEATWFGPAATPPVARRREKRLRPSARTSFEHAKSTLPRSSPR
jgi:hypothetical protein